ncbi:HNH endonuclease [Klebsiella pneumoniae]
MKKVLSSGDPPAQGRFRREVMSNWENQCAITGIRLALEAAHIVSHARGGNASVENGICLTADLHTLLDSRHLLILMILPTFRMKQKTNFVMQHWKVLDCESRASKFISRHFN